MEKNYTSLNIEALYPKPVPSEKKKESDSLSNTIFLVLATLTILIISIVLFVFIQKNIQSHSGQPSSLLQFAYSGAFLNG